MAPSLVSYPFYHVASIYRRKYKRHMKFQKRHIYGEIEMILENRKKGPHGMHAIGSFKIHEGKQWGRKEELAFLVVTRDLWHLALMHWLPLKSQGKDCGRKMVRQKSYLKPPLGLHAVIVWIRTIMEKLENRKTLYTLRFWYFREKNGFLRDKRECEGTLGFLDFKMSRVFEISWSSKGFCHSSSMQ